MKKETVLGNNLNSRGFSLIELMLAMVIGTIVLSAMYAAITEGHRASTGIEQKISAQQDIRAALDIMSMELANASLNPTSGGSLWLTTTCVAGGVSSNKGIQTAAANTIAIEMDLNADGVISPANEMITYNYDAANQQITRLTGCVGGAQPFLGDAGAPSATARNVLVINNILNIPMFRYFDGNGVEFVPIPATIPNIRKIRITIAVQAAAQDMQGQSRRLVYSSDVIPRNHVIPASLP